MHLATWALEHGFETPGLAVISEQDILGDRLVRGAQAPARAANFLAEASASTPGDLVVHVDHGIGRYEGLKTLERQGAPHDCLELEYAGGDKLYLPVENIELLIPLRRRGDGVQLDRLGGAAWQARKAQAQGAHPRDGRRPDHASPPSALRATGDDRRRRRACSTSSAPASPMRRPTTS